MREHLAERGFYHLHNDHVQSALSSVRDPVAGDTEAASSLTSTHPAIVVVEGAHMEAIAIDAGVNKVEFHEALRNVV